MFSSTDFLNLISIPEAYTGGKGYGCLEGFIPEPGEEIIPVYAPHLYLILICITVVNSNYSFRINKAYLKF